MATLQLRNGSYRVLFCFRGKRHTYTLGKVANREAELASANVERLLLRLEQNLLQLPSGGDIVEFVRHDGTIPRKETYPTPDKIDLLELSRHYLETHGNGALESNSLLTTKIHLKHWQTTLGPKFPILELKTADLQSHIDRRLKKRGTQGQPLSAATICKVIAGLLKLSGAHGPCGRDFPTGASCSRRPASSHPS